MSFPNEHLIPSPLPPHLPSHPTETSLRTHTFLPTTLLGLKTLSTPLAPASPSSPTHTIPNASLPSPLSTFPSLVWYHMIISLIPPLNPSSLKHLLNSIAIRAQVVSSSLIKPSARNHRANPTNLHTPVPALRMEPTVWFENGKLTALPPAIHAACASQPSLLFHPSFTPQTWHTDPFVLFQNAIRHEIQDLYIMLRSAALCLDSLHSSHALCLQTWIAEFSQLVSLYFLVQERVIYPAVLKRGSRQKISFALLKQRTKSLVAMLLDIHKESLVFAEACQARENRRVVNFDNDRLHQSLHRLTALVAAFVSATEDLFAWEIDDVAQLVATDMGREEAKELQRQCVHEIVSYEVGENVFAGFSQWIPPLAKTQYLSGVDVLKMSRLRRKEKKWFKNHKSLQMKFGSGRP